MELVYSRFPVDTVAPAASSLFFYSFLSLTAWHGVAPTFSLQQWKRDGETNLEECVRCRSAPSSIKRKKQFKDK